MLFVEPDAPADQQWNFVIELAFDPHNPPSDEEKEKLNKAFEHIMGGVVQILGGAIEPSMEDFTARGSLH